MSNPYEPLMPPGPFGRAVDAAVAAENKRAIAAYGPEDAARDKENAARWAALTAAQEATKGYGVVLPLATVEDALKVIRGEQTAFEPETIERMIESALKQAKAQKEQQP